MPSMSRPWPDHRTEPHDDRRGASPVLVKSDHCQTAQRSCRLVGGVLIPRGIGSLDRGCAIGTVVPSGRAVGQQQWRKRSVLWPMHDTSLGSRKGCRSARQESARKRLARPRRGHAGDTSQSERVGVSVGWQDGNVVTFGRLYLNSLSGTRRSMPRASKVTWMSRLVRALSTSWTKG